jgi:hypothetical protein
MARISGEVTIEASVEDETLVETVRQWLGVVVTGAWAALASVAMIVIQVVIFMMWRPMMVRARATASTSMALGSSSGLDPCRESAPTEHLDRDWPDTGPTGSLY